jgi:hypothetical protein
MRARRYDFGSDTEPPQFDGKFMRFVVIGGASVYIHPC